MIYNILIGCCGETISSIILEGPTIDKKTLNNIIDAYEQQWVDYVSEVQDKYEFEEFGEYGGSSKTIYDKTEKECLKKIKESFPINKYFSFEDYEDMHAFALNMLIQNHNFKKIENIQIGIEY